MLDAGDLDGGRGSPGQRREHNAAQGIAQRSSVTALQRLHDVLAVAGLAGSLDALNLGLFNFDHAVYPPSSSRCGIALRHAALRC